MKKLFIIAHTWKDTDMTIELKHTPEDALKKLESILKGDDFRKPEPEETPEAYYEAFLEWEEEELQGSGDVVVRLEVFEYLAGGPMKLPTREDLNKHYKAEVDLYMKAKYGGTSADMMIDEDEITQARDDGDTPTQFVDFMADKYGWKETKGMTLAEVRKAITNDPSAQ